MTRDPKAMVRVAAAADLHCREHDHGRFRQFVKGVNEEAELLLLCGDLTDSGRAEQAKVLAEELSALRVPCVAVLGNHDYDQDTSRAVVEELKKANVRTLDGDVFVFEKVLGVAGVKGFGGGFGRATLQAFGEQQTKAFVQEAVNEALKLEGALSRLEAGRRVVITHYSPVSATTEGENVEIRPFLGSSRLERPIDEYAPAAVFHGHAHYGSLAGRTERGVPVYNVAMPLLVRQHAERRYVLLQL